MFVYLFLLYSSYLNLNSNEFPLHALRGENSICNFDILGNRKSYKEENAISNEVRNLEYNITAGTYYADETNKINKIETTNNTNYTNELTHDLNGNITDDGKNIYVFDVENKLLSATNKTTSAKKEYFYDAESRLIKERVISSGSEKSFLYNGSQIVEERNNAGALLQWNIHGLGIDDVLRISTIHNSQFTNYYYEK